MNSKILIIFAVLAIVALTEAHRPRKKCVPVHPKTVKMLQCKKNKKGGYHITHRGRYSVNPFGIIADPCTSPGDKIQSTCSGKKCCVPKNPKNIKTDVSDFGRIVECRKKPNGKYIKKKKGGNIIYVVPNNGRKMDPCKSPNNAFQDKWGRICCIKK